MTFAVNKEEANIPVTTLVRLRPRMQLTDWVEDGGNPGIYRRPWTENVVGLLVNSAETYLDEEDSEAACIANPDSFFHDEENDELVLNLDGDDPTFEFVVVEWDVRLATRDLNWFENPMDSASGDAHWSGGIVRAPAPQQGNSDLIFGYSPVQVTSLQIQVADGALFEYLHDWSLNGSPVKVWLCVGDLRPENVAELFSGVGGSFVMSNGVLDIDVQDPLKLLDSEYPGDLFSSDDFPALDPNDEGSPIREVFGFLPSFLPVNIDYQEAPDTAKNRDWVVSTGTLAESAQIVRTILSAPSNTETELADVTGLRVDDDIMVENGGVASYTLILGIDYNTNVVTHEDLGARTVSAGDELKRPFVSKVLVRWENLDIPLQYGRDWTEADFANNTRGIVLVDNFEAAIVPSFPDFPTLDPATMVIWVKPYGGAVLPKKLDGITDFGELTRYGATAGHPIVILWEILRNRLRTFREVVLLDETAWEALALDFDRTIGLAIPETKTGAFPTWREVVQLLLQTELLRMHFKIDSNELSLLTLTQTSPTQNGGREITELELQDPQQKWDFSEIYDRVVMNLNFGELFSGEKIVDKDTSYTWPDSSFEDSPLRTAAYLHRVSKTFTMRSLFCLVSADTSDLVAWRLAKLVGDRRGTLSGNLPIGFLDESIDDDASVQLKRLTGFAVTDETRTRNYKYAQHQKSAEGVNVILDDQKNMGRWE